MLAGLDGAIDVIVPRGGKSLVARVQAEARVPVFAHLEGICHVYVDKAADLDMAKAIVLNAKMRRTGVCGAAETLLVDRAAAPTHLKPLVTMLLDAGCEVRGDDATRAADRAREAGERGGLVDRISRRHHRGEGGRRRRRARSRISSATARTTPMRSSPRTRPRRRNSCARSIRAIVLHNASTQFADGGEFGFGAEIGIATGRLHARGPVGVEQLTTLQVPRARHRADQAVNASRAKSRRRCRREGCRAEHPRCGAHLASADAAMSASAARARHAHRPVRRHVRSAARGASRRLPARACSGSASTASGGW